jgi:nucleoside triphosphate diphosphatase
MTDPQHISRLLAIMARLRDPVAGCPWDLQQDFATIAPYTIEEAYEVADAIDRNDLPALKDELGDLLLQVVFHAQMAQEAGHFGFGDVVQAISDKMERRHPHVFDAQGRASAAGGRMPEAADAQGLASAAGGRMPEAAPDPLTGRTASVEDADAQTRAWEAHKKREREAVSDDRSALAGIARGLPEWQRATKLQKRAAALGFDWPGPDPVIAKLHEEIEEVRVEFAALATDSDVGAVRDRLEDEIGDVLFVCVNLARHAKVDFGAALRRANHKFERRFRRMEQLAAHDGIDLAQQPLQAQDAYWDRAKAEERKPPEA